jgi:hypothetical protein
MIEHSRVVIACLSSSCSGCVDPRPIDTLVFSPLKATRVVKSFLIGTVLYPFGRWVEMKHAYRPRNRARPSKTRPPKMMKPRTASQKGEMGDLETSLVRFLSCSSDLPMRASCSFANLALRRRCSGVWAIVYDSSFWLFKWEWNNVGYVSRLPGDSWP